jgi:hypothetical protein
MLGEITLRARLGTTLAVLGALGAIAAGSLTATASAADSYVVPIPADQFDVVSAAASPTNPDQLPVVVDSLSPVAGLTAQFLANGVDTYDQVLTLASTVTDPTGPAGSTQMTWTANIPVGTYGTSGAPGTPGLPLGNYSIGLSGTFTDSATATYPSPTQECSVSSRRPR